MAKTKLSASPDTEKTRQKIIFFPSDNAEQLLQKLECFAQGILANYNDETDTGSEEVAYANAMLMRVKQTRRFMADAMRSRQEENMSLNVNAAVREAINAMLEFVSLHNSGIEPSYLRGEKTIKNASEGGFARAREYKQRNSKRQQEILDYARNFAGNPRSLASCAAKKFKLTPKTIREILKKTGFQIQFPYLCGGEVVNVKYRDGEKHFCQAKDAEKIFYGLDDVVGTDTAIIVEGEMDKLALEEAGIINVLSVPDGAPNKLKETASPDDKKFEYIGNSWPQLEHIKTFVLAVDNDEPGKVLEEELARRLGREKCLRVNWPTSDDTPCKDANEVLMAHGADILRECIDLAAPYPMPS